jgi:hypothetical protein
MIIGVRGGRNEYAAPHRLYLPFVGLLPRPPPDGLPVLLGAFSSAAMFFSLKIPGL